MSWVLIKYDDNWADEFDLDGHKIMQKDEWEKEVKRLESIDWPQTFWFGSNEDIEYSSFKDFMNNIRVHDLSDKEKAVIRKCFGMEGGNYPYHEEWQ